MCGEGLILDPLRGAKEDGVKGFFSGAGKGLVGLVVKPGVGVIDMTSRAFAGIRNAAAIAQGPLTTARKARFIPLDGRLSVFDRVASEVPGLTADSPMGPWCIADCCGR